MREYRKESGGGGAVTVGGTEATQAQLLALRTSSRYLSSVAVPSWPNTTLTWRRSMKPTTFVTASMLPALSALQAQLSVLWTRTSTAGGLLRYPGQDRVNSNQEVIP